MIQDMTYDGQEEKEKEITQEGEMRAENARQKAKHVLEKIKKAKRAVGDRVVEHQELMAFYEGKQYELSKYKISRPWVVRMKTPFASTAVDTRVSSLIASDYEGELLPMSPDDTESVKALNLFIHDEWQIMDMDNKVDEAVKASAIVREAYVHIYWLDEKIGKGTAERDGYMRGYSIEQPSSIYIDPNANSLRKARYVGILTRFPEDEFKEEYPDYADYISKTNFTAEDRGEVSFLKDYEAEQDEFYTMITLYEKRNGKIHKSIVVEDILVEETELSGHTMFPIAQMRWKRANASPYGISLMDEILDLQKAINSIESAITNTAVAYSAPSYAVRQGSGLDPKQVALAVGVPGVVYSVQGDVDKAIKPIAIPKLDQSIIGVKNEFVGAIDRIAGITNPYLGSIGTSGNTAQGSKMALERARIIEADVLHNIEIFVEELVMIMIEFTISQYEGEDIVTRKVDKATGEVKFATHNIPDNLGELVYTFFINLSTKTSYSKEREKEKIMEMYQMQHQYKDDIKLINQLDIINAFDFANQEELITRWKSLSEQSSAEKAELITQIVTQATQLGIEPQQVNEAIVELLSGVDETPIMDALVAQMRQMAQESAVKREQAMQSFTQNVTEAGVAPQAIQGMQQQMMGGGSGGQSSVPQAPQGPDIAQMLGGLGGEGPEMG